MHDSAPIPLPLYRATYPDGDQHQDMLYVSRDGQIDGGLYPFQIVGIFDPHGTPPFSGPECFRQNGTFMHFMHWVISIDGPKLANACAEARRLGNGTLEIIDGRARLVEGEVPDEEILGRFQVSDGKILEGTYESNFEHRPLNERGVSLLDPELASCILARMEAQVLHERSKH